MKIGLIGSHPFVLLIDDCIDDLMTEKVKSAMVQFHADHLAGEEPARQHRPWLKRKKGRGGRFK